MAKDNRTDFGDYYNSASGGRCFRWLDIAKKRMIQRYLDRLAEGSQILDLGCGSAGISSSLAHANPRLKFRAADSNGALLDIAKARGLQTDLVDFDQDLPYAAESFDMVIMIDAIEHVECRTRTMSQVKRILAPNATFLAFTPPYDTLPWLVGERMFKLVTGREADHICPFTKESLKWLMAKHFAQSEIGYLNFGLTMWGAGQKKRDA